MSTTANSNASLRHNKLKWHIGLWAAQILLALFYGFAGTLKTFMPPDALPRMGLNYATEIPFFLLRFIGISELVGTIGILIPALTRIKPSLSLSRPSASSPFRSWRSPFISTGVRQKSCQ